MQPLAIRRFCTASILIAVPIAVAVSAQAPAAIQLFLPGGALPSREIRFTLTRDDGQVEILLTDTKGKYQLTGDLARDPEYTIVIDGDRRTYDTTTQRFRVPRNITHVPIFLRPPKGVMPPSKDVVDVSVFDAKVPPEARAAYNQAMKAVGENIVETAISEFTRALSIYPQYIRALNDLGALYLKLNRFDEAAATFTQAISLNSRFNFPRLNLGVVYNRQGNHGEAIKVLDQLLKEQPSLTGARIQIADALIASAQTDAAQEQLRLALAAKDLIGTARADAHFKLGFLLNREERYATAAAEFEKGLAINPKEAVAHLYFGGALLNLKKYAEAEPVLLKAYELGGSRVAGAQLFLGQLYYLQQKFDLSQRAFEQYLKDMPNAPNAAQVKGLIEKIKATTKQE